MGHSSRARSGFVVAFRAIPSHVYHRCNFVGFAQRSCRCIRSISVACCKGAKSSTSLPFGANLGLVDFLACFDDGGNETAPGCCGSWWNAFVTAAGEVVSKVVRMTANHRVNRTAQRLRGWVPSAFHASAVGYAGRYAAKAKEIS